MSHLDYFPIKEVQQVYKPTRIKDSRIVLPKPYVILSYLMFLCIFHFLLRHYSFWPRYYSIYVPMRFPFLTKALFNVPTCLDVSLQNFLFLRYILSFNASYLMYQFVEDLNYFVNFSTLPFSQGSFMFPSLLKLKFSLLLLGT